MEVLGGYLNHAQQTEDLVRLLGAPGAKRTTGSSVPIRRAIRLHADQIAELVASYQAGETVYSLVTKFSINRNTVWRAC